MNKLSTSVDVVDGMSGVTLHVDFKRTNELWWRMKIAMWLLAMAARILNCGIEFGEDEGGHDEAD